MAVPRFGRFVLLERLGTGGAGEVLLVDDGGQRRALKRLLPHLEGAAAVATFEREAALARRLSHPNVVTLFEHGEVDGVPYLLMELVDGVSVHELVRRAGRLPAGAAAFVARELCRALAYLHALGDDDGRPLALVHRDVSPTNVLVARDGAVKLCDFGIAKATATTATVTVPGVIKGKRGYLSPEQAARTALDARSDVYAVGVVLFEALTGRRPEAAEARPSARVAEVPAALDAICARALADEREARFASAAEMAAALDAVVAERGGAAELAATMARACPPRPATEATRTRTLVRRGGARRWALPALLAAAALATALVVARERSRPEVAAPLPMLPAPSVAAEASASPPVAVPPPASASPPVAVPPPASASPPPVAAAATTTTRGTPPPAKSRAKHARPTHAAPPRARDYMPDPWR